VLAPPFRLPTVHCDAFDGPLELLLFIVRKDGVDLRQVRIAPIADAYLSHLAVMEQLDLDVAAEFLVMASTLCWLKSRELLPRPRAVSPGEDDPLTVRAALTRRLQDYLRYRDAAEQLDQRPQLDRDVFTRPADPVLSSEREVYAEIDAFGLLERFFAILQVHAAPPPVFEIERETWSVQDAAEALLDRLRAGPRDLAELLSELPRRGQRVITFLATLELTRRQVVSVEQDSHLGPVRVRALRSDPGLHLLVEITA
jgi:segregation and condensation protein A